MSDNNNPCKNTYSNEAPGRGFYEMQLREKELYRKRGMMMHYNALVERQRHWWPHFYATFVKPYVAGDVVTHEEAVQKFYDEGGDVTYLDYQGEPEAKKVRPPTL